MEEKKDKHVPLMDQIAKEYSLDEDAKKLPGFGKPLPSHLFKGDMYSNFLNQAKNAGYLPPFVDLQKQIRAQLEVVKKLILENQKESELEKVIDEINAKIKKYNECCPPKMQRGKVTLAGIERACEIWE